MKTTSEMQRLALEHLRARGIDPSGPEDERYLDELERIANSDPSTQRIGIDTQIRIRAYSLISERVEQGLRMGWNRAHKHTDAPSEETILDQMHHEVMLALDEILNFGDD